MAAALAAELRTTAKGMGVFALRRFGLGEVMLELRGQLVPKPNKYTVQVSEKEHLDIEGTVPSYLNHSCEPNGYVDYTAEPITLRALRDVQPDEELNFDYGTTEWDMASPFECQCGAAKCRGAVRGLKYLDPSEQRALLPKLSPAMQRLVLQNLR